MSSGPDRSDAADAGATQRWRRALLQENASVRDAIRNLDQSALQIALVVSGDGTLLGTLTDGDIRRGLLKGMNLDSPVDPVVQRQPLVAPPQVDREAALQLMRANLIRQLPVVDERRRVVGLHLFDEITMPHRRSNLMVIMAGGRGQRLQPHTNNCPKPLLPVRGKPILEHIIERAKQEGFSRFVLAVNYLGHMIEDYFGDGSSHRVEIRYLRESTPLGTAGAVALLDPRPTEPFIVSNGDVLTDIRYGELLDFHLRHQAAATMAVRLHEWQHPFGVVETRGVDLVSLQEKPTIRTKVNAGIYVIDPRVLVQLSAGSPCDMPDLFRSLQRSGERTVVFPIHESWMDIGRPDDYEDAAREPE